MFSAYGSFNDRQCIRLKFDELCRNFIVHRTQTRPAHFAACPAHLSLNCKRASQQRRTERLGALNLVIPDFTALGLSSCLVFFCEIHVEKSLIIRYWFTWCFLVQKVFAKKKPLQFFFKLPTIDEEIEWTYFGCHRIFLVQTRENICMVACCVNWFRKPTYVRSRRPTEGFSFCLTFPAYLVRRTFFISYKSYKSSFRFWWCKCS